MTFDWRWWKYQIDWRLLYLWLCLMAVRVEFRPPYRPTMSQKDQP